MRNLTCTLNGFGKLVCIMMIVTMTFGNMQLVYGNSLEDAEGDIFTHAKIRVYPHIINPNNYPDDNYRNFETPDWDTFNGRLQMKFSEDARNRVIRVPNAPSEEEMTEILEDNNWIYIRGGKYTRIPGIDKNTPEIETSEYVETIDNTLGTRYLGNVVGEVDGGYVRFNPYVQFPLSRDKMGRYLDLQAFIDPFEAGSKGHLTSLHNISGYHAMAKEGTFKIIGTQNFSRGHSTVPIQFALTRGAGKQYGLLWRGQYSAAKQFGEGTKSWVELEELMALKEKNEAKLQVLELIPEEERTLLEKSRIKILKRRLEEYENATPEKGVSISVYRNFFYSMYLYNSAFISYEESGYYSGSTTKLNPVGEMWSNASTFIEENKNPGAMLTPVAFLGDFNDAFWRTPEVWRSKGRSYSTWDNVPYDRGNWVMHNLFDMVHRGYRNSNWFANQRYEFPGTPYGDLADVVLSDVTVPLMNQYSVIVAASELTTDTKLLKDKVSKFVNNGGNFIVTGDNAKVLWPEWQIGETNTTINAGDTITFVANGYTENIVEEESGTILSIDNVPANSNIIGKKGDIPAVVEIPQGEGTITLILSPYGINDSARDVNEISDDSYWTEEIQYEFGFLKHVEYVMDSKLSNQSIFNVGNDELRYITCAKGNGEYTLGIINGSPYPQTFEITSNIGDIEVEEYILPDKEVEDELGFYPEGLHGMGGISDDTTIRGGAIRLFKVMVAEGDEIEVLSEITFDSRPVNRYLRMDHNSYNLKKTILKMPSFYNYFGGIKFNGAQIKNWDMLGMKWDIRWLNDRHTNIIVDGRDITEVDDMNVVIDRLLEFKYDKKIILPDSLTDMRDSIEARGITVNSIEETTWIDSQTDVSNIHSSGIIVLDMSYDSFDSIYEDLQVIESGMGTWLGTDQVHTDASNNIATETAYLTVRGTPDIQEWLATNQEFYDYFGGIKLDAEYLYKRSNDKWIEDANYLSSRGIDILVDFSSQINFFDFISFTPSMFCYDYGMELADNVFSKMELVGIEEAIFMGQMGHIKNQLEGITNFVNKAQQKGITLNLRNLDSRDKNFNLNRIKDLLNEVEDENEQPYNNLRIALNMISKDDINASFLTSDNNIKYVLLGTPGGEMGTIALPFHMQEESEYSNLDISLCALESFENKVMVYDADYKDWNEIIQDVNYLRNVTQ